MLTTIEAVIEALGGVTSTAALSGVGLSAVSNWKARGRFPSEKFLIFSDALGKNGNTVDPVLFGFSASADAAAEART